MKNYKNKYIDEFLRITSSQKLLEYKIFPNAKEITESFAMYSAMRNLLYQNNFSLRDDINIVVVGDGHTPMTAALCAVGSAFKCHSIDPALRNKFCFSKIDRLFLYKNKIQEIKLKFNSPVFLILPHSHVSVKDCLNSIEARIVFVISMDCCLDTFESFTPDNEYCDSDVWSEKNKIRTKRIDHVYSDDSRQETSI